MATKLEVHAAIPSSCTCQSDILEGNNHRTYLRKNLESKVGVGHLFEGVN